MDQVRKTRELRQAVNNALPKVLAHIAELQNSVQNSNLSERQKSGYLSILQRSHADYLQIKNRMSTVDPNSFKEYQSMVEQYSKLLKLVEDIKKIREATNASLSPVSRRAASPARTETSVPETDFPDVPTGKIVINQTVYSPVSESTPNVPAEKISRFIAITDKVRELKNSIDTIRGLPAKTTEQKVERYALVSPLIKEQQALQKRLDTLGRSINSTRVPLTTQQIARLDQSLNEISQQADVLNRRMARAYSALPTAPSTKTSDNENTGSSYKRK